MCEPVCETTKQVRIPFRSPDFQWLTIRGLWLKGGSFLCRLYRRCSIFRYLQHHMVIEPILRYPRLASGMPRQFSGFGIQLDMVRKWRFQQYTRYQQTRLAQSLAPALV